MSYITVETRKAVYERDKYTCQYCGKVGTLIYRFGRICVVENPNNVSMKSSHGSYNGRDVIPFQIDHIIPVCYGGKSTLENLKLSCRKCNMKKGYRLLGVDYGRILA